MTNFSVPKGRGGYEGLIAAIMWQAVKDVTGDDRAQRIDACDYFINDLYVHHLWMLGLDLALMPECLRCDDDGA